MMETIHTDDSRGWELPATDVLHACAARRARWLRDVLLLSLPTYRTARPIHRATGGMKPGASIAPAITNRTIH